MPSSRFSDSPSDAIRHLSATAIDFLATDIPAAPIPTYTSGRIDGSSVPNRRKQWDYDL
jgi:hypothetical protein